MATEQVTLVSVLRLNHGAHPQLRYGPGQYLLGADLAHDAYVRAHMLNGQPNPAGTPFDNPGPPPVLGPPERSTWAGAIRCRDGSITILLRPLACSPPPLWASSGPIQNPLDIGA